jgi:hypothetical protein
MVWGAIATGSLVFVGLNNTSIWTKGRHFIGTNFRDLWKSQEEDQDDKRTDKQVGPSGFSRAGHHEPAQVGEGKALPRIT